MNLLVFPEARGVLVAAQAEHANVLSSAAHVRSHFGRDVDVVLLTLTHVLVLFQQYKRPDRIVFQKIQTFQVQRARRTRSNFNATERSRETLMTFSSIFFVADHLVIQETCRHTKMCVNNNSGSQTRSNVGSFHL